MGAFEARFGPRDGASACFGAIDVGAGKIACLVARAAAEGPIDVLGAASVAVRSDVESEARPRLVRVALDQALRMAGDVWPPFGAAYAGADLKSVHATGTARIRSGAVTPRDVAAAIAAARAEVSLAQRRLLHAAPIAYYIDDGEPVADPRGLTGAILHAEVCLAHAPADAVAALEAILETAGARPAFMVAAPFAAGYGVLTAEERETGAVVVDLGEAGVGLGVFRGGGLAWAETLPGCGLRLTQDLAARLGTTLPVAERAKRLYGGLAGEHDAGEAVEIPVLGDDGRLTPGVALRGAFAEALGPWLEETFARIAARLDEAGAAGLPVALTGGVSQTQGLRALAACALSRPVRIASLAGFGGLDESASAGAFATAAGLIRCAVTRPALPRPARPAPVRAQPAPQPLPQPQPEPATQISVGARARGAVAWIKENF
jgi:cell division protein FtsA